MITINELKIDSTFKNIEVEVTTDNISARFTKVFVWTIHTFRDYGKSIEVSDLLSKNSNVESFTISAETLGSEFLYGIYYIEFRTDEIPQLDVFGNTNNQTLGLTANLFNYKECLLDKVLKLDIKGCGKVVSECEDCKENTILLNTLLNTLESAILNGFLEETVKISKKIEDICGICHTCPDYKNTNSYYGYGLAYQNFYLL